MNPSNSKVETFLFGYEVLSNKELVINFVLPFSQSGEMLWKQYYSLREVNK